MGSPWMKGSDRGEQCWVITPGKVNTASADVAFWQTVLGKPFHWAFCRQNLSPEVKSMPKQYHYSSCNYISVITESWTFKDHTLSEQNCNFIMYILSRVQPEATNLIIISNNLMQGHYVPAGNLKHPFCECSVQWCKSWHLQEKIGRAGI